MSSRGVRLRLPDADNELLQQQRFVGHIVKTAATTITWDLAPPFKAATAGK